MKRASLRRTKATSPRPSCDQKLPTKMMTVAEFAARSSRCKRTVLRRIASRDLPAYKDGTQYLIAEEDA
jgi:excisionase family DNA binding protein